MTLPAAEFFSKHPSAEEERDFWTSLRLPNGTFKTTVPNRLDDVNELAITYWKSCAFEVTSMLDVAVSSGITSVEWLDAMIAAGFHPRLVATDICINARLIRPAWFCSALVRDTPRREPLQYELFGRTIRARPEWRWPSLPLFAAAIGFCRVLTALPFQNRSEKTVQLISREALKRIDISFVESDLFDANATNNLGTFEVVRTANLLNRAYFSEAKLKIALRNIKRVLNPSKSFFIAVRTLADGTNNGTMFRFGSEGRLTPVLNIGTGSEIAELAIDA